VRGRETEIRILLRLSEHATRRPVLWIAAFLLLTLVCLSGFTRLRIRTDGSAVYPTANPVIQDTIRDRVTFRDPRELILLVTPTREEGPSLLSLEGITYLRSIRDALLELEGLHPPGVLSLGTIPDGMPRSISRPFPTFLDTTFRDAGEFDAMLERIRQNRIASGLFVTPDGTAAALYVGFRNDLEPRGTIEELRSWIDSRGEEEETFRLRLLGPLVAETMLGEKVLGDLARLIPVMVAVIAVLLLLSLGTPGGVLVPMTAAVASILWILGIMGHVGSPVTLVSTVLPVLLMAMSITDEVHLLERIQAHLSDGARGEGGSDHSRENTRRVLLASLREVGSPIVATSVTTAIAFLSFLSASMSPVRDFGLFASVGILLAMMFTFTFIPALIVLLPARWLLPRERSLLPGLRSIPRIWERGAIRQSNRVLLPATVLLAVGLPGLLLLRVEDSWVRNFDPDDPLVVADREFNERFWGTYRYDVVFRGEPWFFYTPEGVALLEECARVAEAGPHVGGTFGHVSLMEEVADEYGEEPPVSALSERQIRRLGAWAEIALGRPLLARVISGNGSTARMRVFVKDADYPRGLALEAHLREGLTGRAEAAGVQIHFSGDLPSAVEVVRDIVTNQLRSIGWTLVGIAALLLIVFRNLRTALILLIPVIVANWLLLAGLGYLRVPLGIASSMFASLTIGVGIDYPLHLLHAYRRHRSSSPDRDAALEGALGTAGRAIRWNAIALGVGFAVLGVSGLPPNRALGLLLGAAMFLCYGSTLFFLPRFVSRRGEG
jgi:predicted RND superfamily exporter protein